jgi:hypothetical protein
LVARVQRGVPGFPPVCDLLNNLQRHHRVNFPHRIAFGLASPV